MKTETSYPAVALAVVEKNTLPPAPAPVLKMNFKSDLHNHRFAVLENKQISDPLNWDLSWFSNYE
jgi:hypothetical protein